MDLVVDFLLFNQDLLLKHHLFRHCEFGQLVWNNMICLSDLMCISRNLNTNAPLTLQTGSFEGLTNVTAL